MTILCLLLLFAAMVLIGVLALAAASRRHVRITDNEHRARMRAMAPP